MVASSDLPALLGNLEPTPVPGRYVFTNVQRIPDGIVPIATVVEQEGTTLVVEKATADECGFPYDFVATMITLQVHSHLQAVGLTAAIASALAEVGISCNVLAGYFHDHIFVPETRGQEAVSVLQALAGR